VEADRDIRHAARRGGAGRPGRDPLRHADAQERRGARLRLRQGAGAIEGYPGLLRPVRPCPGLLGRPQGDRGGDRGHRRHARPRRPRASRPRGGACTGEEDRRVAASGGDRRARAGTAPRRFLPLRAGLRPPRAVEPRQRGRGPALRSGRRGRLAGENRAGAGRGRCHFRRSWYPWRDPCGRDALTKARRRPGPHRQGRSEPEHRPAPRARQSMADADYDEFGTFGVYPPQRPAAALRVPQGQTWVRGAGALTSVALIVGLGVWAYDLAVRDVRGVPVIQALEGPARTAPDNPGGELASYQGMAVNEIAADGTAAGPADRLTLAPRADDLTAEDRPMGALAASAEAAAPAQPAIPEMAPADGMEPAAQPALPATGEEVPLLASLTPGEPLPDGVTDAIALDESGAAMAEPGMPVPSAAAIPADVPGVARSLRPASRPVGASAGDEAVPYDAIAEAAA